MNRHFWRACTATNQSGVTLVELLVTIIIAGIAFAALVPVFVGASQSVAKDNARTVSLSVAQDKIERIRSLSYEKITTENLLDPDLVGSTAEFFNGNGSKEYQVEYTLTYVYDPASTAPQEPGYELYKQVTVDVYWNGPPTPVKHTVLKTDIYRQYAGPVIYSITVEPRDTVVGSPTNGMIVPEADGIVTISAYLQTGLAVKEVRFTLSAGNGSYTRDYTQTVGVGGVYAWEWDTDAAPDGYYTITATGFSPGGYMGNTWQVNEQLEGGPAHAPVDLKATAGDRTVVLDWTAPATGDIAYYRIVRSPTNDVKAGAEIANHLTSVHYPDEGLTNNTTYYYWVFSYDLIGQESVPAAVSATPELSAGDTSPPSAPGLTGVSQPSSILLSWTPVADQGTPASGLDYYEIFRSTDGASYTILTTMGSASISYADPVGTGSPQYWYKIRAVDLSANINRSAFSAAVGPLQTVASVQTLTVSNDRKAANQPCTVTVRDVASKLYYDQDGATSAMPPSPAVSLPSKGGVGQWNNLPSDKAYTVTATYASGKPPVISQAAPPWTLSFK